MRRSTWLWALLLAFVVATIVFVCSLGPASLAWWIAVRFPDVQWVQTESLAQWMRGPRSKRLVILDVRSEDEFSVSHLLGAHRLDPEQPDVDSLRVPEDATVVVYCSVGYRSAAVVEKLHTAGIGDVYNLEGGIFAWANENRPIHRGRSLAASVHPYDGMWGYFLDRDLHAPLVGAE